MMGRDAALPLAPASVALGRGPSLCPHAVVRAPAARHALRPGRGPPAGGAQRVPDPAFRVRVACRGQRTPSRRRLARRGRRGPADHRPRAGGRGRVGAGGVGAGGVGAGGVGAEEWAEGQPEDEQPTTVFSPSGLVAWALAPDDGPPTTVLHLDLPPAEPDVRPARGSTGAHRAVSIGSLPVVPLRRLAHRNPVAFAGDPGADRTDPRDAGAFGPRHGAAGRNPVAFAGGAGADSTGVYAGDAGAFGPRHGAAGRSPVAFAGDPGAESTGTGAPRHGAGLDGRAGGLPHGAGVGLRAAGVGVGRRLAALVPTRPGSRPGRPHARPARVRVPGPGRLRLGRRPVFSLVLGLAVVIGLALLVIPTRDAPAPRRPRRRRWSPPARSTASRSATTGCPTALPSSRR